MSLFLSAVISGVATGVLIGLLGFGIVLLYKATGVANFAQGTLATLGAFLCYRLSVGLGLPLAVAVTVGFLGSLLVGALAYLLILRPRANSGRLNLTIRTLGLQMLTIAVVEHLWSSGQPFPFPAIFPNGAAFGLGATVVSWSSLGILVVALLLAGFFAALFRWSDIGLMFLGVSERPEIARMLGVRTQRLTMIAWMAAAGIATIVGVLLAPSALLSSDMMEPYMLLAFTAVVVGGLTSLPGVFLGGVLVGVTNNIVTLYGSGDLAVIVIFGLLLAVLSFRPQGIFGKPEIERL